MAETIIIENIGKYIQVTKGENTEILELVSIDENKGTCTMFKNKGRGRLYYQFHTKEDEVKYSFKLMSYA